MLLSTLGDGGVQNGRGGSFASVGFTTSLILSSLELFSLFVGLHVFLSVRVFYYAGGY